MLLDEPCLKWRVVFLILSRQAYDELGSHRCSHKGVPLTVCVAALLMKLILIHRGLVDLSRLALVLDWAR